MVILVYGARSAFALCAMLFHSRGEEIEGKWNVAWHSLPLFQFAWMTLINITYSFVFFRGENFISFHFCLVKMKQSYWMELNSFLLLIILPSKQEDFIILFLLCPIFAQANTTENLGFCKGLFLFLPLNTWFLNLSRFDHLICNLFLCFRN